MKILTGDVFLAAVGYAGVDVPVDNVDIMLGGLPVMLASSPVSFDDEEMKDSCMMMKLL